MKKIITTTICFLFVLTVIAQKGMEGLIQTEKDFAAYSVAHSTKEAFQKFIDSNSIMFDNGKPVKAIEFWEKREKRPGKLDWWPEYAEIASSGDFGYTTGPWSFSNNDTARAEGYFITVWHLDKKSEWKFLVDLGVSNTNCDFAALKREINQDGQVDKGTKASLKQAEEQFIAGYQKDGKLSYKNFLSAHSRLFRNRSCVASVPEQRYWIFDSLPPKIQYGIDGLNIASSGDIGYIYGTTVSNGKTDNYLHIWRREKTGWKIAVEVLRY